MTMASLMKELYIALGVIVVIAAGVFFLWRRHRNNAVKALQVSSGKDAVEKKNKKGEIIRIANCVIVRSRENGGAKYEYIEPAKIPVECTPTPTEWLNRSMYWLKGDGNKDSETLTPFTVSDEIVEYPGSLMDTIQAKPIKEFLKLPAGLLEKVAIWACVVVIGVGMFIGFIVISQPAKSTGGQTGQITTTTTQPVLTPITLTTNTVIPPITTSLGGN